MRKRTLSLLMTLPLAVLVIVPVFFLSGCSSDDNDDRFSPMVTAGFGHTTVLREDGTIWSWGRNEEGQLGDGSRTNRATPVRFRVEPFTHNGVTFMPPEYFTSVASHKIHTLALGNDGSVWAGGWNQEGQLGAPVGCRLTPIRVPFDDPSTRITQIDAGMLFSIALRDNGNVYGWGRNRHGIMMNAVNNANPAQRINVLARATRIEGLELYNITQIAAGNEHVLALRSDGAVIGWGRNRNGQVGDFRHAMNVAPDPAQGVLPGRLVWDVPVPMVIPNLPSDPSDRVVRVIGGGFHSLALTAQGHIYAWGRSDRGQIGDGISHAESAQPIPTRVILPEGRRAVYVAGSSADSNAAILDDGTVITWGRNQEGQLGMGAVGEVREDAFVTVPVLALRTVGMTLSNITSIAVGDTHMSAICGVSGDVLSWGTNWDGQLGDSGIHVSVNPLQVQRGIRGTPVGGSPAAVVDTAPLTGVTKLASGNLFSLALSTDGTVQGWGRNNHGQLIMQHSNDQFVSTRLEDFRVQDAQMRFPGIRNAWITNMGQTASDPNLGVLTNVTAISAGMEVGHAFALAVRGGYAYGWWDNMEGWLGHGDIVNRRRNLGEEPKDNNPRRMQDGSGRGITATDVSAGARHSLILRPNGDVYAAGRGGNGRLGHGIITGGNPNTSFQFYPVRVAFPAGTVIVYIEAGMNSSFAIDSNGYLWAWGHNGNGQLGTGNTSDTHTPVKVLGPSIRTNAERITSVSSGLSHTLAITNGGRIFTWGNGGSGRLGHGTSTTLHVPTHLDVAAFDAVANPNNAIIQIAAGGAHSAVVRADGTVWSWGYNASGQLGRPSDWSTQLSPRQVSGLLNVTQIVAGNATTTAIVGTGETSTVWTWGTNSGGALGSGGDHRFIPRPGMEQGGGENELQIIANRTSTATRAHGVHATFGFFNAFRPDFPPVNITAEPEENGANGLIIAVVVLSLMVALLIGLGTGTVFYTRRKGTFAIGRFAMYIKSPKQSTEPALKTANKKSESQAKSSPTKKQSQSPTKQSKSPTSPSPKYPARTKK